MLLVPGPRRFRGPFPGTMPQTVTWRADRRRLDLSLWPRRPLAGGIAMLVAGLLAVDGVAVGLAGWVGGTPPPHRFIGLTALSLAVLGLLAPAALWQRFGRERILVEPGRLRIVHDYRLFRRVRFDRRFRELEASSWADLENPDRGWLLLRVDRERVRARVLLDRPVLVEATGVIQRFVETLPGQGRTLYVVHHN